jgi:hypothetical protein
MTTQDAKTGAMWRSSQYVHPKSPPVILKCFAPRKKAVAS